MSGSPSGVEVDPARQQELAERLAAVRARIARAVDDAGRDDEPTLIVVTKFFPTADLVALADLGVSDVGENREQELTAKLSELTELRPDLLERPRRHFIGQLQSKKAKRVAQEADVVQCLDRAKLIPLLDAGAAPRSTPLDVLVQVDLSRGAAGRGGVDPSGVIDLAAQVVATDHLRLRGLMAVAPLGESPEAAFARLATVRDGFREQFPDADWLSAGMSGDLEHAVRIGATHLRVGSAILGSRTAHG